MVIKECLGYELEKSQSNTFEDFFNRSEVKYLENGEEKVFHLLYLRYFDEFFDSFTPFEKDPLFTAGSREVHFKDIVALVCLLKRPELINRKRVYINTQKEFEGYFSGVSFEKVQEIFAAIVHNKPYELMFSRN